MAWMAYSRALVAFRREGDSEKSRKLVRAAVKHNLMCPCICLAVRNCRRHYPTTTVSATTTRPSATHPTASRTGVPRRRAGLAGGRAVTTTAPAGGESCVLLSILAERFRRQRWLTTLT